MKTKILSIVLVLLLSSCSYFRVVPQSDYTARSIVQYDKDGKFIVLHRGDMAWHAYDLRAKSDSIKTKLDIQLGCLTNYINPKEGGLNQYYGSREVVNSVHFYTTDTSFSNLDTLVVIPESGIYAVKSYEYARAPSMASKIVPIVVLPVAALVLLTVAVKKSMEGMMDGFSLGM